MGNGGIGVFSSLYSADVPECCLASGKVVLIKTGNLASHAAGAAGNIQREPELF
jgi:hypothetical protein